MRRVALSQQGKHKGRFFALVSDKDLARVNQYRWTAQLDRHTVYAYRRGRARYKLYLHCFLLGCKGVDHKDGNGLNNMRRNLRKATISQNACNARPGKPSASGVRGVVWSKWCKRWVAGIWSKGKRIYLGSYTTLTAAKSARLAAVKKYHGKYAFKGRTHDSI